MNEDAAPKKYAAFISYRHTSPDQQVAQALHKMLEYNMFRPHRGVRRNIRPVFLDTMELPLVADLNEGIMDALDRSECLFVICSEKLPLSQYCMAEIQHFKQRHGGSMDRIYTVLVSGEPGEAFPDILRTTVKRTVRPDGTITEETVPAEPLFADVRGKTVFHSLWKLFRTEYLRLAAAYFGCSYDQLYKRNKRRRIAIGGLCVALAMAGILTWQHFNANMNSLREEKQILTEQKNTLDDKKRIDDSVNSIRERIENNDRLSAMEEMQTLWNSFGRNQDYAETIELALSPLWMKANYVPALTPLEHHLLLDTAGQPICPYLALSSDEKYILAIDYVVEEFTEIRVYDSFLKEVIACQIDYLFAGGKVPVIVGTDNLSTTNDRICFDYDEASAQLLVLDSDGKHRFDRTGAYLSTEALRSDEAVRLDGSRQEPKLGIAYGPCCITDDGTLYYLITPDSPKEFDSFSAAELWRSHEDLTNAELVAQVDAPANIFNFEDLLLTPDARYLIIITNRGIYESILQIYDLEKGCYLDPITINGGVAASDFRFDQYASQGIVVVDCYNGVETFRLSGSREVTYQEFSGEIHSSLNVANGFCYISDYEGNLYMICTENASVIDLLLNRDNKDRVSLAPEDNVFQDTMDEVGGFLCTVISDDLLQFESNGSMNTSGGFDTTITVRDENHAALFQFAVPSSQGGPYYNSATKVFGFVNYQNGIAVEGFRIYTFQAYMELLDAYF